MGLKINNIFIDSEQNIREGIANFSMLNCRSNYTKYLESSSTDEFEKKYILKLNDELDKLCVELYKKSIKNLTEEELREQLIWNERNGIYGIYDRDTESLYEYLKDILTDKEAHEIIKSHMEEILDLMIEANNKTQLDKMIDLKESELVSVIKIIDSYQNLFEKKTKLQEELDELKSKK